jgi:hypothetical protein
VDVIAASRWPTPIDEAGFRRVTGEAGFPPSLAQSVRDGTLEYSCNTLVSYALRGVHVTLNVIWDWEAAPGAGDTHFAYYRGTRARIDVRQTRADGFRPELYVVPAAPSLRPAVLAAVRSKIVAMRAEYPDLAVDDRADEIHVVIPDRYRVGHEAHFAEVTKNFLRYLEDRSALPAWERPNMLAKYYVTTRGTELAHQGPPAPAPRLAPQ